MKKWHEMSANVVHCAWAMRKCRDVGKEIPAKATEKMNSIFDAEEIRFIKAYIALPDATGADYMTVEEMENKSNAAGRLED